MNLTKRQIAMITGFLILCGGIFYLLYYVFFRPIGPAPTLEDPNTEQEQTTGSIINQFPTSGVNTNQGGSTDTIPGTTQPGGLLPETGTLAELIAETQLIVQSPAISPILSNNGQDLKFYDSESGQFYRVNDQGEQIPLSDKVFYNVENITWSSDTNKTILEYPDDSKIYYNFETGQQATLPKNWEEFSFNETGSQIAFKETSSNPEFQWLSIANPDGTSKQAIEHLGLNDERVAVEWSPNDQIVGHHWEGESANRTRLLFIGKNKENFKATYVEGYGIESKWTPNGEKLLYSAYSENTSYNPNLWVVRAEGDTIGQGRIDLGLRTWPEKCTFANDNILYCAVPEELPEGAGLDKRISYDSTDLLYRIDLTTGQKRLLPRTDLIGGIKQIIIDENEENLFLMDHETNYIHKVQL